MGAAQGINDDKVVGRGTVQKTKEGNIGGIHTKRNGKRYDFSKERGSTAGRGNGIS